MNTTATILVDDTTATILVDDVTVGTRVLYPVQRRTGTTDEPLTVSGIVEYPATRVLYFAGGGFGVADRGVRLPTAPKTVE